MIEVPTPALLVVPFLLPVLYYANVPSTHSPSCPIGSTHQQGFKYFKYWLFTPMSWLSLDFRISNITDDCDAAITAPGEHPNNDKHFALYAAIPALGWALNIQHWRQLYNLYRLHRDVLPDCYLVILHCHAEYHWNKIHRFTPHKINVRVRIHPSPIRDLCAFNLIRSIDWIKFKLWPSLLMSSSAH